MANARRTYSTERHRLYTYQLSPEGYAALLESQNGACLVCGDTSKMLVVDHDHRVGSIRGLLCGRCNRGIGHLLDSPGICRRAAEYLRWSAQRSTRSD